MWGRPASRVASSSRNQPSHNNPNQKTARAPPQVQQQAPATSPPPAPGSIRCQPTRSPPLPLRYLRCARATLAPPARKATDGPRRQQRVGRSKLRCRLCPRLRSEPRPRLCPRLCPRSRSAVYACAPGRVYVVHVRLTPRSACMCSVCAPGPTPGPARRVPAAVHGARVEGRQWRSLCRLACRWCADGVVQDGVQMACRWREDGVKMA
jgi:hypothetical protein